ncbi:sugar transporter (hexose transporter) [Penicillium argentinense]|uniref:Sugar transporter (Hexose transporter) n=1 Tax=Penicillium argentinense TaxID=1131581 RepID=A0A9W9FES0_9EURO|nr:sugar transporter (hexose transporter) [Penicillium argentinense]KAJ5098885.1 sugar transporter (hexose transporter) [Penicillium argentinense]
MADTNGSRRDPDTETINYTVPDASIMRSPYLWKSSFFSTNGYNWSLLNGLQKLDVWQSSRYQPTGAWLGFINTTY